MSQLSQSFQALSCNMENNIQGDNEKQIFFIRPETRLFE